MIIFFTITFLTTLRWCNLRIRPQRETRGVSRSKCGDLITATIPVTWAGAIIVHESTDAIDFYDGFGTTEMAIGIRAFQWGWEYYYPKDLDLNYAIKNSNSSFVGNSLNYSNSNSENSEYFNFFNFYKNKDSFDGTIMPAHIIMSSSGDLNNLNIYDSNNFGFSKLLIRNAFKNTLNSKTINFDSDLYKNNLINDSFFFNYIKNKSTTSLENLKPYPIFSNYQTSNLATSSKFNNSKNFSNNKELNKFFSLNGVKTSSKQINYFLYKNILNFNNILENNKLNYKYTNTNNFFESDSYNFSNSFNFFLFKESNLVKNIENTKLSFNLDKNYNLTKSLVSKDYFLNINSKALNIFTKGDLYNVNTVNNNKSFSNNYRNFFNYSLQSNFQKLSGLLSNYKDSSTVSSFYLNDNSGYSSNNPFYNLNINNNSILNENLNLLINSDKNYSILNRYNFNNKLSLNYNYTNIINNYKNFYPSLYADLDFKRISSLELYEDLFWQVNNESQNLNENIHNFSKYSINKKYYYVFEGNFWKYDNENNFNFNKEYSTFFSYKNFIDLNNFNSIESDYGLYNYSYLNQMKSSILSDLNKFNEDFESSFIVKKNYITFLSKYNLNFLNSFKLNYFLSSDLISFNQFWSDFDYTSLVSNTTSKDTNILTINNKNFDLNSLNFDNFIFLNKSSITINPYFKLSTNYSKIDSYKSIMTANNALWKVYRGYFDDQQSSFNFKDLSNSYQKVLFLKDSLPNFKRLLFKNKTNFSNNLVYLNKFDYKDFNNFSWLKLSNMLNYFTYEFPFFVSIESDSIRYTWFDWYSLSNRRVAKALDTNQYNLYGVKKIEKNFDFRNNIENLVGNENYLTKLTNARKVYLQSWTYSTFLTNKLKYWTTNNNIMTLLDDFNYKFIFFKKIKFLIKYLNFFDNGSSSFNRNFNLFDGGYSNFLVPSRNYWRSPNSNSYSYYINLITDILVKREYLFRKLLKNSSSNLIELPNTFITSPSNPIIVDFKSILNYNSILDNFNENNKYKSNKFFTKIKTNSLIQKLNYNDFILKKSQYKHMRKSISNMIRIQADKSVAMPTDTRIQLLTVSRDIIHSWAIPSAGIKIDCIPGYSSHKVTMFILSGVYWGQCMEICGRFHHWMPIVVYFLKRDLFVLWCINFILKNNQLDGLNQNSDKVTKDFIEIVSFNENTWNI